MSKYRAVRTNGYASKAEANRAAELHMLSKAGHIENLQEQVSFELLPVDKMLGFPRPLRYVADFVYTYDGIRVVEDVKGMQTPVYKLKKRLMAQLLGITITETGSTESHPRPTRYGKLDTAF